MELFKVSDEAKRKKQETPVYHIQSGCFVETDMLLSQVYVGLYNDLKDKVPLYTEDFKASLEKMKLKSNLSHDEELFYVNVNFYMPIYLNAFNYKIKSHDRGFDVLTEGSSRTLMLIVNMAIEEALKSTEVSLLAEQELERTRELELEQEIELGDDFDEIEL